MGAISLRHGDLLGIKYIASGSYLPGEFYANSQFFSSQYACDSERHVGVFTAAEADLEAEDVRAVARNACAAWSELQKYFLHEIPVVAVEITLVPEDRGYQAASLSVGTRKLALRIALRHFRSRGDLFFERYLIRALAHELLHLYAAQMPTDKAKEETLAYMMESCVELEVLGTTFGDITQIKKQTSMIQAAENNEDANGLVNSLRGAAEAHQIFNDMRLKFPVRTGTSDGAKMLLACASNVRT